MPSSRLQMMSDWAGREVHLTCWRAGGLSEDTKLGTEMVQQEPHVIQQIQSITRGAD